MIQKEDIQKQKTEVNRRVFKRNSDQLRMGTKPL